MSRFADRVPIWVTINEPNINFNNYIDNNNILIAHAKVYHFYKEELGGTGRITLMVANNFAVHLDPNNSSDVEAALRYQEFILGIEANPLSLGENYTSSVLSITGINLIGLSSANLSYINNTIDFFSFDPCTTQFATAPPHDIEACAANLSGPLYLTCVFTTKVRENSWINGGESYAFAYLSPQYFRQHLGYVWNAFRLSGIAITEFGFHALREYARTKDAKRYDFERASYFEDFVSEILKATHEDGVNVIAAFAWSIMDNNEFGSYEQRYGLQLVNRTVSGLSRTYKRSIKDYVDFFHSSFKPSGAAGMVQ